MGVTVPFVTKSEWVYHRLREMIVEGRFRSGEHLRLGELARMFQTSEMPVREALRMLQRDGLVDIHSHRGAVVADVGWEHVYEAVKVRTHLEVLAVAEAAPHHDEGSVALCADVLDRMDAAAARGDHRRFSEGNRRFHTLLYEPCPSRLLTDLIQELWDKLWRTRSRSLFRLVPERMAGAQEEHRAVLEAVRAGDAALAAEAMARHRERTLEAWRRVVEHPPF